MQTTSAPSQDSVQTVQQKKSNHSSKKKKTPSSPTFASADTVVPEQEQNLEEVFLKHYWEGVLHPLQVSFQGFLEELNQIQTQENYSLIFYQKFLSGIHYPYIISSLGHELYGSARFEGEEKIKTYDFFSLSQIPAEKSSQIDAPLLFAGGFLPLGDNLFRFLPEANFFQPFLDAGFPVFALEKEKNWIQNSPWPQFTLERYIEILSLAVEELYARNRKKCVLVSYCGLGIQVLSYLMAKPEHAKKYVQGCVNFVAPINGKKNMTYSAWLDRRVFPVWGKQELNMPDISAIDEVLPQMSGLQLQMFQDFVFQSGFDKTYLAQFIKGFSSNLYEKIPSLESLSSKERKDLTASYWVSNLNAAQQPLPKDLLRFFFSIYRDGISSSGEIPYRNQKKAYSLKDIAKSGIPIVGFYGSRDFVAPERTGWIMQEVLGDQYQHIVHENLGHVSYILSPRVWSLEDGQALSPHPFQVIRDL